MFNSNDFLWKLYTAILMTLGRLRMEKAGSTK